MPAYSADINRVMTLIAGALVPFPGHLIARGELVHDIFAEPLPADLTEHGGASTVIAYAGA